MNANKEATQMKIVIGQVAHETNTFSNVKTTKELFELWEWDRGEAILENHRGVQDYLGGMIDRGKELGIEILPSFSAFANPSGTVCRDTYDELIAELIAGIKQAGEFDAICLALHGAGVVEGIDDLEGDLLQAVRNAFGYEVPIVVTLDLHANLTEQMVQEADALLGVNFYPHTDSYERGKEAVDLAEKIVAGEVKPVMHLTKLPLIISTSTTNLSPAKDINEMCWQWEKEDKVVDCTFFHGFPHTDTPDVAVSVLTITNGERELARVASEDVAIKVWERRAEFLPNILTSKQGIEAALASEHAPVVINETSDNPGGGTPGDGTHLLRAMLELQLSNACFGIIYDPEVVNVAYESGVGSEIDVLLGGKTDSLHGEPIAIRAYVKSLTDGRFVQTSPMWYGKQVDLGKSVRLQVGGVDIIVCSVRSQVFDEQVFLLHGIDIQKYKIVALKSSQHFRAAYESLSQHIITVDSPGLSSVNLLEFGYQRIARPICPLDLVEGVNFDESVKIEG
jgi:microcystin degradation protein MlrC